MTWFKAVHAVADDWAHVAQACVEQLVPLPAGANLGFVYATDVLADDLSSVLTYLRQRTRIQDWVGSVGVGICGGDAESFDRPALAVMVGGLPEDAFRVFPTISEGTDQLGPLQRRWIAEARPHFGIVHGDPNNAETAALVEGLAGETTSFLVGGLTSSRAACYQVAGRLTGGGVSGILFAPRIEVATGLTQGCAPIGGSHVISDCLDNVLIGLDGRRALDVFMEDAGEFLDGDLGRIAGNVHAAIPIEGSDTGDYLVRSLIGVDPARGWLAVGNPIQPGDRVMFVRRDPDSAVADLVAMLEKLKGRLAAPPKGGLYFTCVARGPSLFGAEGRELALIRESLGAFPLVGFYGGGEISNSRLYAYTGVLALFL